MTEVDDPVLDDGYGRAAPLAIHVQRKIRFAEKAARPLPPWHSVLFGERGFGPGTLPWDGVFRPLDEFEPRWHAILDATTRDWVNLDIAGVNEGRLVFVVEYMTDERPTPRTWDSNRISVNGGVGGYGWDDPVFAGLDGE